MLKVHLNFLTQVSERLKRRTIPVLSIKERLKLEKYLPSKVSTGKSLARALGYLIDDRESRSLQKLQQYSDFYRYYPKFAKVSV